MRFVLLTMLAFTATAGGAISSTRVRGPQVLINDKPAKLWGVRVASAVCRDQYTKELIDNLDFYKEHGINTLVVYCQGSTGQTQKAFSPDGKSIDAAVRDRMRRLIDAAAAKDMIVIVGLFMPRKLGSDSQDPRLESRDAYLEAAKTAAEELKQFSNVMLSLAHDASRGNYANCPLKLTPEEAVECLKAIAAIAPNLPRGCGGPDHAFNNAVAASEAANVVFHTEVTPQLPKFTADKPIVNLCLFGVDSGGRTAQGVWPTAQQDRFGDAIGKYLTAENHHLCAHFQGWHEGGMDLKPNRFTPGGAGTVKDPGTAWYFAALQRKLNPVTGGGRVGRPSSGPSIFD